MVACHAMLWTASYPDVSLRCARKGRREGDNGRDVASPAVCTLPMVPCGSSPVTRFALASRLCNAKNEAPEEEADTGLSIMTVNIS